MAQPTVARILGFALAVRDPAASARFYCEGLGFEKGRQDGKDCIVHLQGVDVRLVQTSSRLLPPPQSANAPDFQHFAIRVRSMAAAFEQVAAFVPAPISHGGPQQLPPSDGSVVAWKFRDPDGHPLELLQFPRSSGRGGLFERVDHTAVACRDLDASLGFYGRLGFTQGKSTHNEGAPQDRLDGLADVDLQIATMHTSRIGPHIELLHYRKPSPPPSLSVTVTPQPFISTYLDAAGSPTILRDPDGHNLDLH